MRATEKLCLNSASLKNGLCKCISEQAHMIAAAANDNYPQPTIILECEETILSLPYQLRLQTALIALESGRRDVPTWIADTFLTFDMKYGQILYPDPKNGGRLIQLEVGDETIDVAFGATKEDHGSFRWVSDWRGRELKQRGQRRILLRFQLMAAAFKIAYPCVAHHFAR